MKREVLSDTSSLPPSQPHEMHITMRIISMLHCSYTLAARSQFGTEVHSLALILAIGRKLFQG